MKYVKQLFVILAFSLVAEALAAFLPLPVPAPIYGIVLLFLALCTGFLKVETIADTARYLIKIMPILFVAPGVGLLAGWDVIAPALLPISVIVLASTLVVFAVSGLVTRLLRGKEGRDHG